MKIPITLFLLFLEDNLRIKIKKMPSILIIDDEKSIRRSLSEILSYEKYTIEMTENAIEALKLLEANEYDAILCDIKMPEMDGIEALPKMLELRPDTPVIMLSGHGNIDTAVEAIKLGAFDFIEKPVDLNRLLITLKNALDKTNLITETKVLKKKVSKKYQIIGASKQGTCRTSNSRKKSAEQSTIH